MQKIPTLLKVMSILSIILGALGCLGGVLALVGSLMVGAAAGAASGSAVAGVALGGVLVLATLLACVNGILMLVAGIKGIQGKLDAAWKVGIAVLVLAVLGILSSLLSSGITISSLISLAIPILFLVGVKQAREL